MIPLMSGKCVGPEMRVTSNPLSDKDFAIA